MLELITDHELIIHDSFEMMEYIEDARLNSCECCETVIDDDGQGYYYQTCGKCNLCLGVSSLENKIRNSRERILVLEKESAAWKRSMKK